MLIRRVIPIFIVLFAVNALCAFAATEDPLAAELAQWKEFVRTNPATDETWKSIRDVAEPLIVRAEKAQAEGRRLFAFHLLALIRSNLAAEKYLAQFSAEQRQQLPLFEKEWQKTGQKLAPVLEGKTRPDFNHLPAAIRAIGEAAFSEVKVYYDASIEYGRATVADSGMFYLGSTQAQYDFAQFCAKLDSDPPSKPLSVASLTEEIDTFEGKLLSDYKPPLSIDQHPIFIRVNAMIKQARELNEAGMPYGAFYRYLEARYRYFRAMSPPNPITLEEAKQQASDVEKGFAPDADHSIGRLFVEAAIDEAGDTTPDTKGPMHAAVIFRDVLPHYFLAVESTKVVKPKIPPEMKVTLVRWPYT